MGAPTINVDDNEVVKTEEKRGRKRRNSKMNLGGSDAKGASLGRRKSGLGLRRDSRSGAREVSPAAFL